MYQSEGKIKGTGHVPAFWERILVNMTLAGIFADKRKGMGDGASSSDGMMKMMGGFTVLRLMNLLGTLGERPTKEELLSLNEKLNQIHRV